MCTIKDCAPIFAKVSRSSFPRSNRLCTKETHLSDQAGDEGRAGRQLVRLQRGCADQLHCSPCLRGERHGPNLSDAVASSFCTGTLFAPKHWIRHHQHMLSLQSFPLKLAKPKLLSFTCVEIVRGREIRVRRKRFPIYCQDFPYAKWMWA
jgi:hypothetical protein